MKLTFQTAAPWLRTLFSILLLLICIKFVDAEELGKALAQTDPVYFLLAFIVNVAGTVLFRAWIAHLTTRSSGLRLDFVDLIRINLIARFYTIALPRGVSSAIRWHHYRAGGSGHAAAALLMFENLVSVFTLFTSAALILWIEFPHVGRFGQTLLPIVCLGTLLSVLVLLPFVNRRCGLLMRRLLQPLLRKPGWFTMMLERLYSAIADYHTIPLQKVILIFLASIAGYFLFILSAWILMKGMELEISFAAIAWIRSVTLLVALLPVTVGGIGLREGAFIALLSDYGISASTAFAYAIASFAIQLVIGLIGAGLEAARVLQGRKPAGIDGDKQ